MKIMRYSMDGEIHYGKCNGEKLYRISGDIFGDFTVTETTDDLDAVKAKAPVEPSKIVCIGKNYADHAAEMGGEVPPNPIIFIKPSTALNDPDGDITYPDGVTRLDYEAELAVIIKKKASKVKAEQALDYVLGYTCMNDVTARDIQKNDVQWSRAKGYDSFAPLGPVIETELDYKNTRVQSVLNGEIKQNETTAIMIWKVPYLIEFITAGMTLLPGDVIATGTPAGIGSMQRGDVIEIKVENIGTLKNKVK